MKYYTPILTILFIFLISFVVSSAIAQENNTPFGLAMHGAPKYTGESPHLDYINPMALKGGLVKIAASNTTFDTLNPHSLKGQAPENMNLVYDRLMRRVWDEPFTMYPLIAQSVDVPEDRSSITFHLNPNATFSDGTPITTQDVLFSYETLKEYGRPNMRRVYKLVSSIDMIDNSAIKFSLGDGYDRETVMILTMMPVLSKAWWENRDFNTTLTDIPVTSGPYKIKAFEIGRSITYERDETYWAKDLFVNKGHYNFSAISYEYFRDDTIALEAFKKGDLNLRREWNITKWQSAYDAMSADMIREEIRHQRPERAHGFIFNTRRSLFSSPEIRKALSLAFDDNWVKDNILHGQFERINSFYPNSALNGHDKESQPPSLSFRKRLKQANTLLKKSGWIIQNKKRVHQKSNKPFTFEIILLSPQEEKIALAYQRNLERLGIKMTIRMLDSATFQQRKINYDYDMLASYWQNSLSPGTEQMLYWSCHAANEPGRFNYSGICNADLDIHSAAIANAQTYDELLSHAHKIDQILTRNYIMIPLFYKGIDYVAHHTKIKRPQVTPLYGIVTESWWME